MSSLGYETIISTVVITKPEIQSNKQTNKQANNLFLSSFLFIRHLTFISFLSQLDQNDLFHNNIQTEKISSDILYKNFKKKNKTC